MGTDVWKRARAARVGWTWMDARAADRKNASTLAPLARVPVERVHFRSRTNDAARKAKNCAILALHIFIYAYQRKQFEERYYA